MQNRTQCNCSSGSSIGESHLNKAMWVGFFKDNTWGKNVNPTENNSSKRKEKGNFENDEEI